MILPLLGRRAEVRTLEETVDRARRGERVVVAIQGGAGSGKSRLLDEWAGRLEKAGIEARRAAAFAADENHPGLIARQLGLAQEFEGIVALLVDDLHWADPTSIGLLQRATAAPGPSGLLVAFTHRAVTGARAFALRRLGDAARRRGAFITLNLERLTASDLAEVVDDDAFRRQLVEIADGLPQELQSLVSEWSEAGHVRMVDGRLVSTGSPPGRAQRAPLDPPVTGLSGQARKLVEAAALAGRPVSVALAAELLGASADDALELGEHLSIEGYLRQGPEGFAPINSLAAQRVAEGMGEVRRATLFGELGEAMSRLGLVEREPGVAGSYFLWAARFDDALPLLAKAGLSAVDQQALGEALPLLDGALASLERSAVPDTALEGRLRLGRAQCYRQAGWDDLAAEDLEVATQQLSGVEKVHALGWAATVADDRQHVQEAERNAALAELEAIRAGEPAMLGSLLTLHARELSRLGFANEAHAALDKGNSILEVHGSALQRYRGRYSAGWIAYDEGRAKDAEAAFGELALEAPRLGGMGLLSDVEAWWARALFQSGHPSRGLEVRQRALEHADQAAKVGPVFLAHMALAEGAEAYGQYDRALAAADEMMGLVLQQLPAWENAARYLRARALLGLGRLEEAAADVGRALELCRPGIDGWRWRLKCRVLELRIEVGLGKPWPAAEAAELTDQLLHAQWYQTADEMMTLRAGQEGDRELARDAAALAVQLGTAMPAAEAAQAGRLWDDPGGRAVVAMVKSVDRRVPDEWREGWRDLPWVAPAVAAPELTDEDYEEASTALLRQLDAALAEVGLGDVDRLLSPAQRRAAGLVRRRRRRRSPVAVVAVAAAIVVLGGLGGLAGARLLGGGTVTPATGPPTLEEIHLAAPQEHLAGGWNYGGDAETYAARAGVSTRSGVREAAGYYWRYDTDDQVRSSPVLYGKWVIVGSGNELHVIDTRTGEVPWTATAQGAIDGAPTVAQVATGEGSSRAVVIFGSRDGGIYGRDVLRGLEVLPPFRTGGQVVSSPLFVDGVVYVGSTDGKLYALDAVSGEEIWPAFATGGEIRGSPAYSGGMVYVASMDGKLYAIDASTGSKQCESSDIGPIPTTPVVVGDKVLVGSSAQDLWEFGAADCRTSFTYVTGTPVEVSPAVSDGIMYVPSGNKLLAIGLGTNEDIWVFGDAEEAIHSAPVVAAGVIYVGSDDGRMYAVDAETGKALWSWQTGGRVRSSPAIADGAVFFGSYDGRIYAVGGTG
jgi:outer membrane protein assembly factor BamB/tetratricopeptide (TPR) repeat protein